MATASKMKIGILAVQGDFEAHARMLERLHAPYVFVRTLQDFEGVGALILPGGESSTQLKFLNEEGLLAGIRRLAAEGGAFFGTCAGVILLAREVHHPDQESLGLLDAVITRNGYGRQAESRVVFAPASLRSEPLEMVFIRAPVVERVGPEVEVLAELDGKPVLARQGRVLAATFHPELSPDSAVHEYFLRIVANGRA